MDVISIEYLIERFLAAKTAFNTQSSYRTPLKHFCRFLTEEHGIAPGQGAQVLSLDHAIGFAGWLVEQEEYSQNSIGLYLTVVYRFYRYLLKVGMPVKDADLARLQETYRDARDIRGEPRPVDHELEAVQAVIRAARSVQVKPGPGDRRRHLVRLRNIAIVESLRSTGCRVGELVGLRLGDLDEESKSALVRGKGSKYRHVYWDSKAWRALQTYLEERAASGGAVFVGHANRSGNTPTPLTTRHVSRTIRKLADRASVPDVTPHYFRHVFATRALERTDLALVQDMLGHASPVTTRVYAKTDEAQRQAAHAAVWED